MCGINKVSIIVPVYNTAAYVGECLESICSQTYADIEILVVDDGSTDGSAAILDEFAGKDARVKVIQRENGGLSAARNTGIEIAKGKWIVFVDSDDVAEPLMVEHLLALVEKSNAPMGCSGMYRLKEKRTKQKNKSVGTEILTGTEAAERILYRKAEPSNSACGKIFSRSLFENARFREGILYEDLDLVVDLTLRCNIVAVSSEAVYGYRKRAGSITNVFNNRRLDVLDVTERLFGRMPEGRLKRAAGDRAFAAAFNMAVLMIKEGETVETVETVAFERCCSNIKQFRRHTVMNRKARLKNRMAALLTYFGALRVMGLFVRG